MIINYFVEFCFLTGLSQKHHSSPINCTELRSVTKFFYLTKQSPGDPVVCPGD